MRFRGVSVGVYWEAGIFFSFPRCRSVELRKVKFCAWCCCGLKGLKVSFDFGFWDFKDSVAALNRSVG
jgi:hypothetical protein